MRLVGRVEDVANERGGMLARVFHGENERMMVLDGEAENVGVGDVLGFHQLLDLMLEQFGVFHRKGESVPGDLQVPARWSLLLDPGQVSYEEEGVLVVGLPHEVALDLHGEVCRVPIEGFVDSVQLELNERFLFKHFYLIWMVLCYEQQSFSAKKCLQ